jgi:hypothetical protein
MAYVIACGDEGVQINVGTRLGFVGAGFKAPEFEKVLPLLKKVCGSEICVVASQENDWIKAQLDLASWEQVNASTQQHVQAMADQFGLLYAGYLPFADPKQLEHTIKGHMVRPHKVHIATKICFTLGGGEQKYNLGNYVISADWIAKASIELIKAALEPQIAFYTQLNRGEELKRVIELGGELGEEVAKANHKKLIEAGIVAAE